MCSVHYKLISAAKDSIGKYLVAHFANTTQNYFLAASLALKERIEFCFAVSNFFGFGLMDAAALVKYAASWRTVPKQMKCEILQNKVYR